MKLKIILAVLPALLVVPASASALGKCSAVGLSGFEPASPSPYKPPQEVGAYNVAKLSSEPPGGPRALEVTFKLPSIFYVETWQIPWLAAVEVHAWREGVPMAFYAWTNSADNARVRVSFPSINRINGGGTLVGVPLEKRQLPESWESQGSPGAEIVGLNAGKWNVVVTSIYDEDYYNAHSSYCAESAPGVSATVE